MPQSFTCLHYHLVFSTQQRQPIIDPSWQSRLFEYIGGILRAENGTLVAAGGMPDHVHLLASIDKQKSVADTLRDIKSNSSRWIHETLRFQQLVWQRGYGAFAVSFSNLDAVQSYIENQPEHHCVRTFQEEFREMLVRHRIEFDERYIWE
jgi:putative transposase